MVHALAPHPPRRFRGSAPSPPSPRSVSLRGASVRAWRRKCPTDNRGKFDLSFLPVRREAERAGERRLRQRSAAPEREPMGGLHHAQKQNDAPPLSGGHLDRR